MNGCPNDYSVEGHPKLGYIRYNQRQDPTALSHTQYSYQLRQNFFCFISKLHMNMSPSQDKVIWGLLTIKNLRLFGIRVL